MIPVNTPKFAGNEEKYLVECIRTGWVSSEGPFIKKFEGEIASYFDRKYGIAVSSGSAALDIAVKSLKLGKGDEVIVPTFTIISPVQSIVTAGATPVLVESNELTWNMEVEDIEEKITTRTKAILVVHIYGLPVNMKPILELCKKHNLRLIEDAAEMHGQECNGIKCGSFGDISILSFYPNKHITTGEGGMILTNDDELEERSRKLRNLAFEPGRRFVHNEIGWNYRMTNMQAALGLAQLESIDNHVEAKREMGDYYLDSLQGLKNVQLPLREAKYAKNIYWVFGMVAKSEEVKEMFVRHLASKKIGTRPFFWCMHEQPVFKEMGLFHDEGYPMAEKIARNGFYIPSGLGLTRDEQDIVIKELIEIDSLC